MKISFEGTPEEIKKEMLQWLTDDQEDMDVKFRALSILDQHNLRLTNFENDKLPQSWVKQRCQLAGQDWFVFLNQLQQLGVKKKRTENTRVLTNLEIIKRRKQS